MTKTVRIATPCYAGQVQFRYLLGVVQMFQDLGVLGSPFALEAIDGAPGQLVTNRNVLLTRALGVRDLDVLLWVDADCAPVYSDPSVLYRFLQEATQTGVAVVGAACARRAEGNRPGAGRNLVPLAEESEPRPQYAPFEVRSVGLGFTAWNMRWWRASLLDTPIVDEAMHHFEWRGGVSEDYRSCEFVRQRGGKLLVDPRIGTWHDGMTVEASVGRVAWA